MSTSSTESKDLVLVVDDQAEIRLLLTVTLGRAFEVMAASDGAEALQCLRAAKPKVVLLDVMMPGAPDGLGVLREIKSNAETRSIQVGMLTARGQVADEQEARRLGADAYFKKPFSPSAVLAWVRASIAGFTPRGDGLTP